MALNTNSRTTSRLSFPDEPVIDQLSISKLKDPQVKKIISGGSTFYIPSVTDASVSPSAQLTSEDIG
jgi:hypothetical protein